MMLIQWRSALIMDMKIKSKRRFAKKLIWKLKVPFNFFHLQLFSIFCWQYIVNLGDFRSCIQHCPGDGHPDPLDARLRGPQHLRPQGIHHDAAPGTNLKSLTIIHQQLWSFLLPLKILCHFMSLKSMILRENILMCVRLHSNSCVLNISWQKTAGFFCCAPAFWNTSKAHLDIKFGKGAKTIMVVDILLQFLRMHLKFQVESG